MLIQIFTRHVPSALIRHLFLHITLSTFLVFTAFSTLWAFDFTFGFGKEKVVISQDGQNLLAVRQVLAEEIFLYQDFLKEDTEISKAIENSNREYSLTFKKKLSGFVDMKFGHRLRNLQDRIELLKSVAEKNYLLGLVYFDFFKINFEIVNDRRKAMEYLDKANSYANLYVKGGHSIADGYRLYGEIQNQYIQLKGGFSAIYYSTLAKKNYQEALSEDKNHAHSLLLLGIWNLFAPDIAGGSVPKAIELIRQVRTKTSDQYLLFLTFVWEGLAHSNSGYPKKAEKAVARALAIAPENMWAKWIIRELKAGHRPLDSMM